MICSECVRLMLDLEEREEKLERKLRRLQQARAEPADGTEVAVLREEVFEARMCLRVARLALTGHQRDHAGSCTVN